MTDDDILNDMGDVALGVDHDAVLFGGASECGEQGVRRRVQESEQGDASELMAVGGYDGMHLIYEALKRPTARRTAMRWSTR
jgi:branched-chain amino acid transport system substrate-binding protein